MYVCTSQYIYIYKRSTRGGDALLQQAAAYTRRGFARARLFAKGICFISFAPRAPRLRAESPRGVARMSRSQISFGNQTQTDIIVIIIIIIVKKTFFLAAHNTTTYERPRTRCKSSNTDIYI